MVSCQQAKEKVSTEKPDTHVLFQPITEGTVGDRISLRYILLFTVLVLPRWICLRCKTQLDNMRYGNFFEFVLQPTGEGNVPSNQSYVRKFSTKPVCRKKILSLPTFR
jgi:hypothetical protein